MSVINFQCYACNQMLKVGVDKGGKKTKCIKCGTILTIPVAAAEPEVLAPEVIDEPPPVKVVAKDPPAKTQPPKPQPVKPQAAKPQPAGRNDDFVFDDRDEGRPRKSRASEEAAEEARPRKSRRDEAEEDEERPRKRRPVAEEDEEEERPRKRRERPVDDDEEEDANPRKRRERPPEDEEDEDRPRKRRRDEEEEDRPRRRRDEYDEEVDEDYERRPQKKSDWAKVRLGMLLCMIGLGIFGLGLIIEQIGVTTAAVGTFNSAPEDLYRGFGGQKKDDPVPNLVLIKVAVIILPVALLIILAGQVLWLFTNNSKGAWTWGLVSLCVTAVAVIAMGVLKTLGVFQADPKLPYGIYALFGFDATRLIPSGDLGRALLSCLVNILVAIGFTMMALYIRAQALNRKNHSLAASAMFLVILSGIAAGYQLLWPIMVQLLFSFPLPTKGPLAMTWIVYWIGALLTLLLIVVMMVATKKGHSMAGERS